MIVVRAIWVLMAVPIVLGAPARTAGAEEGQPRADTKILPENATEGHRELPKLLPRLTEFVRKQPYGKTWREIVPNAPAPKDRRGLAKAKTHDGLQHDPIEVQEQSHFLEGTKTEVRFGLVSIRGERVFRYGRLVGVQLVLDRIGSRAAQADAFHADLDTLSQAFTDVPATLGLGKKFVVAKNELLDAKRDPEKPRPVPLRIELQLAAGGSGG